MRNLTEVFSNSVISKKCLKIEPIGRSTFPENQMWFVHMCISCGSKIVTKSASMQRSTFIQLSSTVSLTVCSKVEDRASNAYFLDKAFAFYLPKTSPFVSLSISLIHWKAICIKCFGCVGRIDFYLGIDYIFNFPPRVSLSPPEGSKGVLYILPVPSVSPPVEAAKQTYICAIFLPHIF